MDIDEETGRKIQELQILEQHLQGFLMDKQSFQIELNELLNALEEIKKTEDDVYKIIGGIMIKADKKELSKELDEKKKIFELRISSIEKQEKLIENKASYLRTELNDFFHKKERLKS
ncbi:MAG: prefoldin subunit beta [Nanoarchaeota archaeon]